MRFACDSLIESACAGIASNAPLCCGPAPADAGRPIDAEEGDLELVGVLLLVGKLGGPGGAW